MPRIITRVEVANALASLLIQADCLQSKYATATKDLRWNTVDEASKDAKELADSIRRVQNYYAYPDIADVHEGLNDMASILTLTKKLMDGPIGEIEPIASYCHTIVANITSCQCRLQGCYDNHPSKYEWENRESEDDEVPF